MSLISESRDVNVQFSAEFSPMQDRYLLRATLARMIM